MTGPDPTDSNLVFVQQPSGSEAMRKTMLILDQFAPLEADTIKRTLAGMPIEHLAAWHSCVRMSREGVAALEAVIEAALLERGYRVRGKVVKGVTFMDPPP